MSTIAGKANRPILLCFVSYYLPGYRSGGPLRTIANFVDYLGDEFDIRILTRDRDMGDTQPYAGVTIDQWNTVGKAQVFYASDKNTTLRGIARLLRETPHDILYVNSFFDFKFTTLPLLVRRFGIAPKRPCIIAPRGEFSAGAISLKPWKKRLYMRMANTLGLYSDLQWQASSLLEVHDIKREMSRTTDRVDIAPDLPAITAANNLKGISLSPRKPGPLRVVFLSRISPKKNLDFLLQVLSHVQESVELFIYGPVEDKAYWNKCLTLIQQMPSNIYVNYCGEVTHTKVKETFARYDVFAFPTRGENFGHVILESLSVGTPVIVSDKTSWQPDEQGGLQALCLDKNSWIEAIRNWSRLTDELYITKRSEALNYARNYFASDIPLSQNRALFLDTIRS